MRPVVLHNALLIDPEAGREEPGSLVIEAGRIRARLGPEERPPTEADWHDLGGRAVAPGFLDLHFHGGFVFEEPENLPASLRRSAASMLRHGTTGFLPTTVAWPAEALAERVTALCRHADDAPDDAATVLGIHLEGPWIRSEAAGAQPNEGIRPYAPAEGRALLDASEGWVKMVTLAPEISGGSELLAELGRRGIVASLGHSLSDARVIDQGIDQGLRHVTHLFNAMGGVHHRDLGVAGVALSDDRLSCDLICDGVHVHERLVAVAARAKRDGLMLISDRIEPPPPGNDSFGSGGVREEGGALRLGDGRLAGSCLTLEKAIQNTVSFHAMTRLEAVAACTLRPARLLGIEGQRGTLRTGARADLVVLGPEGEVRETWLAGRKAWEARAA